MTFIGKCNQLFSTLILYKKYLLANMIHLCRSITLTDVKSSVDLFLILYKKYLLATLILHFCLHKNAIKLGIAFLLQANIYFYKNCNFLIHDKIRAVPYSKICIKYRKHGSSSFSHTFIVCALAYFAPEKKK